MVKSVDAPPAAPEEASIAPASTSTDAGQNVDASISQKPVAKPKKNKTLVAESEFFDAGWYLETNPDVAAAGVDPVEHYLRRGGSEGRPASPRFHSAGYYALNIEVARSSENPLLHYLESGSAGGASAMSVDEFRAVFGSGERDAELQRYVSLVAQSPLFDPDWFRQQYPSISPLSTPEIIARVIDGDISKIVSPGPNFDARVYIEEHQDVAARQINPFVHYLKWGAREGRNIVPFTPAVAEPALVEPALVEPAVVEPAVVEPALVEPALVEPALVEPALVEPALLEPAAEAPIEAVPILPVDSVPEVERSADEIELELIRTSPLFDATWYLIQYGDVARAGMDPAVHYLRYGGRKKHRRRPSPYFDPEFYIGQQPDLAKSIGNPLVHYIQTGRAMGLKPMALLDFAPPPSRKRAKADGAANPLVDVKHIPADLPDWVRHADIDPAGDNLLGVGNAVLGRLPAVREPEPFLATLDAFVRLVGTDRAVAGLRSAGTTNGQPLEPRDLSAYRSFGPALRGGVAALSDIWFVADGLLRLRLGRSARRDDPLSTSAVVVRAFQADLADPNRVSLVGENIVAGDPSFVDLALENRFAPVLLAVTTTDGALIDVGLLPFPSLARGGAHSGETRLAGERPNLVEDLAALSDALVRELFGWSGESVPAESISTVRVRLDGALGSEQIFAPALREWLLSVLGLAVVGVGGDETAGAPLPLLLSSPQDLNPDLVARSRRREGGATLELPADALPTLSVLVSRRIGQPEAGHRLVGSFIVADPATARPRWSVSIPAFPPNLLPLQPAAGPNGFPFLAASDADDGAAIAGRTDVPVAIRFGAAPAPGSTSQRVVPGLDDTGSALRVEPGAELLAKTVAVVLSGAEQETARRVVEAIGRQRGLQITDLFAFAAGGEASCVEELKASFAGRFLVLPSSGHLARDLSVAARRASSDLVLVLDGTAIANDPRTLETLAILATQDGVASAGCARFREVRTNARTSSNTVAAGYFPASVSLLSAPQLVFAQPNVVTALPNATYPVVANDFECTVMRRDVLLRYAAAEAGGPAGSGFPVRFALAAIKDGWHHLCTTGVQVASTRVKNAQDDIDPVGFSFIAPGRWQDLLSEVVLVREL